MFSDRLDFLLRLTNVSSSALARAISYDQSYISKLRSGKRKLPRNREFFDLAVPYLAKNLNTEQQRRMFSEVILDGNPAPEKRQQVEKLLMQWLCAEDGADGDSVYRLLLDASSLTRGRLKAAAAHPVPRVGEPAAASDPASVGALPFYGNEGKRSAVELFLSRLCATGKAHSLLLYSDEDMSWLYEDEAFARRWSALLAELLQLGGRIKMIHTVSRNVTEMLEAVQKWMPLYLTGRIEPYFCPRLRDGVYRRSLFVARGHSALVSNSVMTGTEGMVNLLFDEPRVVAAFESEFENYFTLCRPLMQVYRSERDAEALRAELQRLDLGGGSFYLAQSLPSFFTMPKSVLTAISDGTGAETLEKLRARSAAAFAARMKAGRQVVELLNLPDPSALKDGRASLPMWPLLGLGELSYDAKQLKRHLAAVLKLLEKYENYTVLLSDTISPELMVMASEHTGALLLCPLPAVFSIGEQNLSTAMLEYLSRLAERARRQKNISALKAYINRLK